MIDRYDDAVDPPLSERGYVDDQRLALDTFRDRLRPDDTVHVEGAVSGVYALVAAEVVGSEHVTVAPGEADAARVADLLASAGFEGVTVGAGASPETTVVVADETRLDGDWLDRVPSSVRHLLAKSGDTDLDDRVAAAGYDIHRVKGFRPLWIPWEQFVEAVPESRRGSPPWGVSARPRRDAAEPRSVLDRLREGVSGVDSYPAALGRLAVGAAYGLYRAPVVLARSRLVTVPVSVIGVALGLLYLAAGVRFYLEGAGASESTVALSVLAVVVVSILAAVPLMLLVFTTLDGLLNPERDEE